MQEIHCFKFVTIALNFAAIVHCAGCCVPRANYAEQSCIVIPARSLASDVENESNAPQSDEVAFVFPSLFPGDQAAGLPSYSSRTFFRKGNKFPEEDVFSWADESYPSIKIHVKRAAPGSSEAIFSIDQTSLTYLRSREWCEVRNLQRGFKRWLLAKSGRLLNPESYFEAFDETVSKLWMEHFLLASRFDRFATQYLNVPESFLITYQGAERNGLIREYEIGDVAELARVLVNSEDPLSKNILSLLPQGLSKKMKEFWDKGKPSPTKEQADRLGQDLREALNDVISRVPLWNESKLPRDDRLRLPKDSVSRMVAVNRAAISFTYPSVVAPLPPSPPLPLTMWATPLFAREVLEITWGTSAIYPFADGDVTGFYSRMTVGGVTRLHVTPRRDRLALFPEGSGLMSARALKPLDTNPLAPLPFPQDWAGLIGTVFVPVYNPLDLLNDRLLIKSGEQVASPPRFLFLLSPREYIKADSDLNAQNSIVQHTTDARRGPPEGDAIVDQLARRYIIVGCDRNDKQEVEREFTRLINAASPTPARAIPASRVTPGEARAPSAGNAEDGPNYEGYVMAIFANQTSLSVGRHVTVNNRLLMEARSRLDTWAQVVGESSPAILGRTGDRPLLEVLRTFCSAAGLPNRRLRVRFYTTHPYVLSAARVGEGDEFTIHP